MALLCYVILDLKRACKRLGQTLLYNYYPACGKKHYISRWFIGLSETYPIILMLMQ